MFKGLIFFVKFSWEHRKSYLLLNMMSQIITGIFPLVIILLPKYIIDELMYEQRIHLLFIYVVIFIGFNFHQ